MGLRYRPSPRFRPYVEKVMSCGHWLDTGRVVSGDCAVLIHETTGHTIAYGLHDGGNDYNGARNFAAEAQAVCGCTFLQPRNRRRSRKVFTRDIAEREDEMRKQARITWLLNRQREHLEAVTHAQRSAFNRRTRSAHVAVMTRLAELKAIETQLDKAWPEWREDTYAARP